MKDRISCQGRLRPLPVRSRQGRPGCGALLPYPRHPGGRPLPDAARRFHPLGRKDALLRQHGAAHCPPERKSVPLRLRGTQQKPPPIPNEPKLAKPPRTGQGAVKAHPHTVHLIPRPSIRFAGQRCPFRQKNHPLPISYMGRGRVICAEMREQSLIRRCQSAGLTHGGGKHPPYILNVKVLYSPVILSAAKDLKTPVSDTGRSACRSQCCKILRPAASE